MAAHSPLKCHDYLMSQWDSTARNMNVGVFGDKSPTVGFGKESTGNHGRRL